MTDISKNSIIDRGKEEREEKSTTETGIDISTDSHEDFIIDEFEEFDRLEPLSHIQHKKNAGSIDSGNEIPPEQPVKAKKQTQAKVKMLKKGDVTVKISGKGSSSFDDFDVTDIGNIDLREAEEIADEDMLFLTENDLIEGLEDFELIPLKESLKGKQAKDSSDNEETAATSNEGENAGDEDASAEKDDIKKKEEPSDALPDSAYDHIEIEVLQETVEDEPAAIPVPEETADYSAESEPLPDSSLDAVKEKEQPAVTGDKKLEKPAESVLFDQPLIVDDGEKQTSPQTTDDKITDTGEKKGPGDDESGEIIFTDETLTSPLVPAPESENGITHYATEILEERKEGEGRDSREETVQDAEGQGEQKDETSVTETVEEEIISQEDDFYNDEEYERFEKEVLPDELQALEVIEDNVAFIDDQLIEKHDITETDIFGTDTIEKLVTDYVDLSQVKGVVLQEGEVTEPAAASLETERFHEFDELKLEFEDDDYKYRDDELDFVENAIFESDYAHYITEIDEYYKIKGGKEISSAREILGLDNNDFELIDDKLYSAEYINVNLDEIFNLIRIETAAGALAGERFCNYLLPREDSFLVEEKKSIEEDISAKGALIFEEDIEKIKSKLGRSVDVEEIKTVTVTEEVFDITDNIVIIEDDLDVDRFVKELPDEKQGDMKILLKYLDGLFEKLPEEVIKKFADSEYFDTYVRVLNEMGI